MSSDRALIHAQLSKNADDLSEAHADLEAAISAIATLERNRGWLMQELKNSKEATS